MKYIKLFENHTEYEDFVSGDTMAKPNVSHCVSENEVHYNPRGVLPENQELWEKFNQIYGDNVTSEDLRLFSTYPMTYKIEDKGWSVSENLHILQIYTNITACFGDIPNPEYRCAHLSFLDSSKTTSIDDYIRDEYYSNYRWKKAACTK